MITKATGASVVGDDAREGSTDGDTHTLGLKDGDMEGLVVGMVVGNEEGKADGDRRGA